MSPWEIHIPTLATTGDPEALLGTGVRLVLRHFWIPLLGRRADARGCGPHAVCRWGGDGRAALVLRGVGGAGAPGAPPGPLGRVLLGAAVGARLLAATTLIGLDLGLLARGGQDHDHVPAVLAGMGLTIESLLKSGAVADALFAHPLNFFFYRE